MAEALGEAPAILLSHGALTVGQHVPEVVGNMIYLEQAAKQQLWASMVGQPEVLPERLRNYRFPHSPEGASRQRNLWRQLVWDFETQQRDIRSE